MRIKTPLLVPGDLVTRPFGREVYLVLSCPCKGEAQLLTNRGEVMAYTVTSILKKVIADG